MERRLPPGPPSSRMCCLFVRCLLETHPGLMLEVQNSGGLSSSVPTFLRDPAPLSRPGDEEWHLRLTQLQCDHLKGC